MVDRLLILLILSLHMAYDDDEATIVFDLLTSFIPWYTSNHPEPMEKNMFCNGFQSDHHKYYSTVSA